MIELMLSPKAPKPERQYADLNYAVVGNGKVRAIFWTEVMANDYVDWVIKRGYTGEWEVREIVPPHAAARR